MKKRVLLIVLAMVLVAALSVGLTLAYLTSHDEVVNTFTVGQVNITLDEAVVNQYGEPVDANGNVVASVNAAHRSNGNGTVDGDGNILTYGYKLIPGHTYVKDPTVTVVDGSEPSYVRMIVTVSNYTAVKAAFGVPEGQNLLLQYYVDGWDPNVWVSTGVITVDKEADTAKYEFRFNGTPSSGELDALFDTFTIPANMTGDDLDKLLSGFKIDVEAHAIQAMGFEDADDAWANFTK